MRSQTALVRVGPQLVAREWQERAHHTVAGACRDPRQAGRRASPQGAQQDGLHLIVMMVRRDEPIRPDPGTDRLEPGVSGAARHGFGGLPAQLQPPGFAWQAVVCREPAHESRDLGALRVDAVVHMGHHEPRSFPGARDADQEVEQRHGVGTTRNRHQGGSRPREEAAVCEVGAEALGEGGHWPYLTIHGQPG
jgi:hypothetical protein